MNLSVLQQILPTEEFQKLIIAYLDKDRKERGIQLPSRKCVKKILAYAYGKAAQDGKATWDEVMEELKKDGTLKSMGINRKSLRRLFFSRQK